MKLENEKKMFKEAKMMMASTLLANIQIPLFW